MGFRMYRHDAGPMSNVSHPLERQPAPAVASRSGYASIWKIWLPIVALFVVLDVTFNLYFWRIPKLSKPNADYGYQFMIDARPLWQEGKPESMRIVAFGSSVALSFDPHQVESLISVSRPRQEFDVHRLLLPGIHPSDYLLYFDGRAMQRSPDVVVVLLNLVDFLYPSAERDVNPTLRFILPPWKLLWERHDHMSITGQLDAVLSGISRLYRYRKLIRSSLHDHIRAAGRWLRGPAPSGPYGIDPDGYTRQRFAVPVAPGKPATLEYFIDPEWLRQRGRVRLEFFADGRSLAIREEQEGGWKTVTTDAVPQGAALLEVRADSSWTPRVIDAGSEPRLRAVRLADPPAVAGNPAPVGYRLWQEGEINDLLRMGGKTGEDFAAAWRQTLEGNTRFGQRFRLYRDAKLAHTEKPFHAGKEYEAVRRLVELFRDRGARVILINTPESPWILDEYRERPYYQGYLEFFRGLAAGNPDVRFFDWSDVLPPEDFNDWHHPNYIGSIKLGERYADALRQVLPEGDGEQSP